MKNILKRILMRGKFTNSVDYWENRYKSGGDSGQGSYEELAKFKAEIINNFINHENLKKIVEFGCGDGNQLSLANYPNYVGLDVSLKAIEICSHKFKNNKSKSFFIYNPMGYYDNNGLFKADLVLSLDVIYHIVEDDIFIKYMKDIFETSQSFVIIYSSNTDTNLSKAKHIKHRKITEYIEYNFPDWILLDRISNKFPHLSSAEFFIYKSKS